MEYSYQGQDVHYEVAGDGEPILLLHGWGCDHTIFDSLVPFLSSQYRLYLMDFPGFGASAEPAEVWGTDDYTRMVEAFCRDLGLERPSLISHSFGGRVSILYASRNPVAKLVLMDAAGIRPHRSLGYYLRVYTYKCVKFFLLKVLRSPELLEKYRRGKGSSDYRNASPRMKDVMARVVNEDLKKCLPKIQAPTLLLWGSDDTATPLSDAKTMKKLIPDAGLVTVQGAGHFSFLADFPLTRSVLCSFFNIKQQ